MSTTSQNIYLEISLQEKSPGIVIIGAWLCFPITSTATVGRHFFFSLERPEIREEFFWSMSLGLERSAVLLVLELKKILAGSWARRLKPSCFILFYLFYFLELEGNLLVFIS